MEKIHENVHVLCCHVHFKNTCFHVNFPFSAYFYPPPHYIIMVQGPLEGI